MNKMNKPLVSICCLTYNHEPYIRECLDGFMMQKTNFSFEVLIHDDASTDKTADIIREYEAKHPNIIKPIYQIENQYSKGISPSCTYQFPRAKGKYIAMCEGDDYWIDPYKLQKQVDFLDANPDFSICCHQYYVKKGDEIQLSGKYKQDVFQLEDIAKYQPAQTLTVVFRNILNPIFPEDINHIQVGSHFLFLRLEEIGKLKYIGEPMAVYRVHTGGVWSMQSPYMQAKMRLTSKVADVLYFRNRNNVKYYRLFRKSYIKIGLSSFVDFLLKFEFRKSLEFLRQSFAFGPSYLHFVYILEYSFIKIARKMDNNRRIKLCK
jgi:glycosyltransferase involved in cell wall biosynthesis